MVVVCVKLLDVPFTVTVKVPLAAVLLTRSVSVLEVVAGFTLKEAVTPLGMPEAARLTLLLNPFKRVMLIVLRPLLPRRMLKLLGEAESEKLGGAVTVREIVVVFVRLPDIPVTVIVKVPVAAPPLTENASVLVVVAGSWLKDAVTPVGKPEAERVTLPLKPFWGFTVMVLE